MSREIDKHLLDACKGGNIDTVEKLIKEGANVNVKSKQILRETPLHWAVEYGHEHVVLALLSHGADPKVTDHNGETPLHWAARHDNGPLVSTLVSRGADANVTDNDGGTPLHWAARHGHEAVVSAFLSQGADVSVTDNDGGTPLHSAAAYGHESVVSTLLFHGANAKVTDDNGSTPLHWAALEGSVPVVSTLLSNGADFNVTNNDGRAPLHLAAIYGHEPVVSVLLSHGADPNVADIDGKTPLYVAVEKIDKPVVSALLSRGADPNIASKEGATPYTEAKLNGHHDICKLIKEALKFPRELQYLSVQDESTFADTLKSGHYYSHVGKLMCVGPEGVGKTAIVSVLRDVEPSKKRIPTDGIDLHTYKAAVDMEKMEWVPLELKAKDVAIRDLALEPKRIAQVVNMENEGEDFQDHDSDILETETDDRGASALNVEEESNNEDIITGISTNSDTVRKDPQKDKGKPRTNQKPKKTAFKKFKQFLSLESKASISIEELRDFAKRRSMKGLLDRALAPVNMMDFGGQAAFYSTHQSFLTYRGLYILVINGSKDFDDVIDTEDFIPGRHGKPTSREFTSFWVSSIQAYSKGGSRYFPKILVVLTHRDKVPSNEAEQKAEKIFQEIEKMFSDTPAEKHLILKPMLFLNAMDKKDPGYQTLKEVLVEQMCSQPSWGEKLPKAWIPLKMIINQKAEEGEMILSLDELQAVNEQNPVQTLSEVELATFLKIHHAQGEIIHFPIRGLKGHIIISPEFLVAALRSLVTDKRFCHGGRMRTLETLNQSGVLCRRDIKHIWKGEKRFMQHKQYLLSLIGHLDIIATPRSYGPDGVLQDSDIYYVPCLVKGVFDACDLEINFETRSLGLSFRFESKIVPPAVGYRLMASCIDMYPIRKYKERNMLFSGLVMLSVNRKIDLLVILRSDRIDLFLIHEKSKDDIPKPLAISVLDCLKDILVNILESYRKTSSEGKYTLSVPFKIEFPCYGISSPCYDTDRTKDSRTCKHGHTLSLEEKDKWFMNTRQEPIKASASKECSSVSLAPFELKDKPSDRLLANVSNQTTEEEMYKLVVQLGLKKYEIDNIMADNRGDLMNTKFLLLRKWKQKTNGGSFEELVKAAENEGISLERIHEMNMDKSIPEWINVSGEYLNDEILDSVANKVINESLLFSVYLGLDPLFWIRLRKDRYDIYEINREVLRKWRQSGDNKMKNLVQALCNVDNIEALSLES